MYCCICKIGQHLARTCPFSWYRQRDLDSSRSKQPNASRAEQPNAPQSPEVDVNADLHMSDVSSSSSDDDPEENPENPVLQPFRPLVVDPESVLADLAASESDQDRVLDSQGLIVDKTTLAGRPVFHTQYRFWDSC